MGDAVVGNAGIRGIALLKESGVNERLEQGARLPPGLDGAVQLGFLRVPSAAPVALSITTAADWM